MRYKKMLCAVLVLFMSCIPIKKSIQDYRLEENKVERKINRNKNKYTKLHNQWNNIYPELFKSDTTWKELVVIKQDTLYLQETLIDTAIYVDKFQDTITIVEEGLTLEIIREFRDTIEKWSIITTLDSFEVIRKDTVKIEYPVIETKYIKSKNPFIFQIIPWILLFLSLVLLRYKKT